MGGAINYSDKGEQIRQGVNNWIGTSGVFDAVIDFDKLTLDSTTPNSSTPPTTAGITCTPTMPDTKPWARVSI
jgi:hypothetical protein